VYTTTQEIRKEIHEEEMVAASELRRGGGSGND
jgi:hypothetical protein